MDWLDCGTRAPISATDGWLRPWPHSLCGFGEIDFQVNLNNPGEPMIWYTNTVEITIAPEEIDASDNFFEDVAFSGPEIEALPPNALVSNLPS